MSEPTNQERARWAKDALAVFTAETFSGDHPDTMHRDDLECAIGDLICDLMHLAQQKGFDAHAILEQSIGHFATELLDTNYEQGKDKDVTNTEKQISEPGSIAGEAQHTPEPSDEPLLDYLDRNWVSLEAFGCFVALYPDRTAIFWCLMMAGGSPERDGDHMNWGQVTAPEPEFVEKVNELFGTSFRYENFAGR